MTTIRLLSYNIRSMRDDRAALARVIRRLEPDIACVQEAPRFAFWLRKRRWLARRGALGLAVRERPAGLELYAGPRTALLHRGHHLLSPVPGMHRRGLVLGLFEVDGARLVAASVHLDLADGPRLRHAEEIVTELERVRERFRAPVVIAGDINEEPGGATWDFLSERFQDGFAAAPAGQGATYGSAVPLTRIDGVFADPGIEVLGCGVPDEPQLLADYPNATDHRPVLAELRVR
jgi:endonuclease/exonuclease/phosphatase family metal-dependent hydrolase